MKQNCILKKNMRDQWFILKNKKIAFFEEIFAEENKTYIKARVLKNQENFYTTPIESSLLNIFKSNGDFEVDIHIFEMKDILAKIFRIVLAEEGHCVFVPERHSYLN